MSRASVFLFATLVSFGVAGAQDCNVLEVSPENAAASPHVCAFDSTKNAAAGTKIRHVLLYDWSNGGHSKTHSQQHMMRLAKKYGFRLDRSQSSSYITPATLQGVDIVVFSNGDQDPLQNPVSLAAMRDFIETQGKGMLAIGAALAFIPCPGEDLTQPDPVCRWFLRAYGTQFWVNMNYSSANRVRLYADSVMPGEIPPNALGVDVIPATIPHGRKNPETRNIFESLPLNGPSGPLANRPYIWEGLWDAWYAYRNHPRRHNIVAGTNYGIADGAVYGPVNILLSIDEASFPNSVGCNTASPCKTGDRPVSWTRKVGNGLAAYNNAGWGNVYQRERFVQTGSVQELVPRRDEDADTILRNAEGDTLYNIVTRAVGDTVRDSLMEKYNWRLMKYLARDYVGCMVPSSPQYNPEASVTALTASDVSDPCNGATRISSGPLVARALIAARAGVIRVTPSGSGGHVIRISDVRGRRVYARSASAGEPVEIALKPGIYFVRVIDPRGLSTATRVDLF